MGLEWDEEDYKDWLKSIINAVTIAVIIGYLLKRKLGAPL